MVTASRPKPVRMKARNIGRGHERRACGQSRFGVPNVRSPAFRKETHRELLAVAASSHARKDQAFIDDVSDLDDE
jgi:hypothetical protein